MLGRRTAKVPAYLLPNGSCVWLLMVFSMLNDVALLIESSRGFCVVVTYVKYSSRCEAQGQSFCWSKKSPDHIDRAFLGFMSCCC